MKHLQGHGQDEGTPWCGVARMHMMHPVVYEPNESDCPVCLQLAAAFGEGARRRIDEVAGTTSGQSPRMPDRWEALTRKFEKRITELCAAYIKQIEDLRACIVYARDRRGHLFDFDTWKAMVDAAMERCAIPAGPLETAQAESARLAHALTNVRKERDEYRRALGGARHQIDMLVNAGVIRVAHRALTKMDAFKQHSLVGCSCGFRTSSEDEFAKHVALELTTPEQGVVGASHKGKRCENPGCNDYAVHGEHWYDDIRWWCEKHVPMSGHYESCPDPCRNLVRQVTSSELFEMLAAQHEHLRPT